MKFDVQKIKWKLAWTGFALLLLVFLIITFGYNEKTWFPIFLQVFGLLLTLYPTVLIFVQSRLESDKANRAMLDHFQLLFQKQIDALAENTNKQITEIQRLTNEQIENYSKETSKVVGELNTNSFLLAEILMRQLEEVIEQVEKKIKNAESELNELKGFKLLRTPVEKQQQLSRYAQFVEWLKGKLEFYTTKHSQIQNFLGETS